MKQVWKHVSFRGRKLPFEVNNRGIVRRIAGPDAIGRIRKSKIISTQKLPNGYCQVTIKHNFVKYTPLVHAVVAFAFLPPPPGEYGRGKIAVNHINGIKSDNRPENLEWVTYQENSDHASIHNLMLIGEDNPASVLTEEKVRMIKRLFAGGTTRAQIARDFGCSYCAVDLVCRGLTWKHIQ